MMPQITLQTQEADARASVPGGLGRPERSGNHTMHIYNGMSAALLDGVRWRKSARSNPSGNCVEIAKLPGDAGFALRNSRDPNGPALIYTRAEIEAFISGAADGDFDSLIS